MTVCSGQLIASLCSSMPGNSNAQRIASARRAGLRLTGSRAATPTMKLDTTPQESRRRHATIVFADISGFMAISEKLDPEEVTGFINSCFERLESVQLTECTRCGQVTTGDVCAFCKLADQVSRRA